MRSDLTHITFILDRSGSMSSVRDDTIGGFNQFLNDQKKAEGDATVTLCQFDYEYEQVYSLPIKEAPELTTKTFVPRGSTALRDAIGRGINETGAYLAAIPEADRPEKVIFVILTDGQENSSREFTQPKQIENMIEHQREAYNWQFVFLGANQDAIATATSMGIAAGSSMTYASNAAGTQAAFASTSDTISSFRSGASLSVDYSEADRKKQREAGANA